MGFMWSIPASNRRSERGNNLWWAAASDDDDDDGAVEGDEEAQCCWANRNSFLHSEESSRSFDLFFASSLLSNLAPYLSSNEATMLKSRSGTEQHRLCLAVSAT